ncbi:MAG: hypothetical protein JNG88_02350 [Phycisphaerales bacterium]|nr:hypothetical protein [Phycisphaerales bacterium]
MSGPFLRRCFSWVATLLAAAALYCGYAWLPGSGGVEGEVRWILRNPRSRQLDRAAYLLTLMDVRRPGASEPVIASLLKDVDPTDESALLKLIWLACEPSSHAAWTRYGAALADWLQRSPPETWRRHGDKLAPLWNAFTYAPIRSPEWDSFVANLMLDDSRKVPPIDAGLLDADNVDIYIARGALLMVLSGEPETTRDEVLRRLSAAGGETGRMASFREGVVAEFDRSASADPRAWPPIALRTAPRLRESLSNETTTVRCKAAEILAICGDAEGLRVLRTCAAVGDPARPNAANILNYLEARE